VKEPEEQVEVEVVVKRVWIEVVTEVVSVGTVRLELLEDCKVAFQEVEKVQDKVCCLAGIQLWGRHPFQLVV
jgi:hypothetical protein